MLLKKLKYKTLIYSNIEILKQKSNHGSKYRYGSKNNLFN